jgi:hypothetical protein
MKPSRETYRKLFVLYESFGFSLFRYDTQIHWSQNKIGISFMDLKLLTSFELLTEKTHITKNGRSITDGWKIIETKL